MDRLLVAVREALSAARLDAACLKVEGFLSTPVVRAIAARYFKRAKHFPKQRIFELAEQLLCSGDGAERVIAFDWAFRCRRRYDLADFALFERWLKSYVDGWGSCDDFCTHAFGHLIYQYPACLPKIKVWASSENRWLRRAAAVVLVYSVRRKANLDAAFAVADLLLADQDDLVQKGYGWLLKEVSKCDAPQVFRYVMARKDVMPRTSLRYAIEKLAPPLRQQAMAR